MFYGEISQTICKLSQNTHLNYATGIFCIRENKDTDQLHSNRAADQRLCFRYIYSIIPLLPKSKILNHLLRLCSPVYVRPGRKPVRQVFIMTRLIFTFPSCNTADTTLGSSSFNLANTESRKNSTSSTYNAVKHN